MKKYYESQDEFPAEEKYLYLLLIAPGASNKFNEPVRGSTWLQKIMHVLSQGIGELNYEFDAHHFGTFSADLQTIQAQNITSDMINQENENGPIQLTDRGMKIAKKLWREIPDSERKIISETKEFLNDMNFRELIAFSYSTFPETTSKSDIFPEFMQTRLGSAISLFKRNKISLKKAISISGINESEFLNELKKKNISPYSINKSSFDSSLRYLESIT